MLKKLSKEKFRDIFLIGFGLCYDMSRFASTLKISIDEVKKKVTALEKEGLVEIQYRDGMIYCFQLTKKGQKIFDDSKYSDWKVEFGY